MKLGDKKAGERYLSPWLFLVWIIIGVGIVSGVLIFFSAQADVRAEEADILAVKITDCIVDNGYINENFFDNFDIFENCSLDEKIVDKSGYFYIDVAVYDSSSNKIIKEIEKGVRDFKMQCSYKTEEKNLAECRDITIYALNQSNPSQKFMLQIKTGSNQRGKKL